MTTRTSILALAALAATSISTLAPTSASAWGLHSGGGYGGHNLGGVYRPMGGVNHGGFGYGSVRPAWYPHNTYRPWFQVARPYWRPSYAPSYQVGPAYLPTRPVYAPSYPAAQPAEPCDEPSYQLPRRPISYLPAPQATPDCETLPFARTAQVYR